MMKMGKLGKWGKVVLTGFVLPLAMLPVGPASYALAAIADNPSPVRSLEGILNSPDIQLSEKAKVGGRVTVVENLEEYGGGWLNLREIFCLGEILGLEEVREAQTRAHEAHKELVRRLEIQIDDAIKKEAELLQELTLEIQWETITITPAEATVDGRRDILPQHVETVASVIGKLQSIKGNYEFANEVIQILQGKKPGGIPKILLGPGVLKVKVAGVVKAVLVTTPVGLLAIPAIAIERGVATLVGELDEQSEAWDRQVAMENRLLSRLKMQRDKAMKRIEVLQMVIRAQKEPLSTPTEWEMMVTLLTEWERMVTLFTSTAAEIAAGLEIGAIEKMDVSPPTFIQDNTLVAMNPIVLPTSTQLIANHEFTTGLENWETHNNPFVTAAFGPIGSDIASLDGSFAVVHTGLGDPNNLGFVQQHLTVHSSTQAVFNMFYNFVTTEFPNWHYAGVAFDDFFEVTIKGPMGGIGEPGEIVLTKMRAQTDMSFTGVGGLPADVLDIAATEGGQTGWKLFTGPSLPFGKGIYVVRIEVQDVADNIFDSAILIDRVSLR